MGRRAAHHLHDIVGAGGGHAAIADPWVIWEAHHQGAVLVGVAVLLHHALQPHEQNQAIEQHLLEVVILLVDVLVPVPRHAPEHVEVLGADPLHQEPLIRWHGVHREVLDADEHQRRVDRREVGDEVREDVRNTAGELGVDQANAGDPDKAKARTKPQDPGHGHLAVHLKLVPLQGAVVPDIHDDHEACRENQRNPSSLIDLAHDGREVGDLHKQ
ncbi:Os09g0563225 [Oryza sativa Japonica Group]|uniref:Os09g0563225 protein n=1 Tax=Oryza sativa subsp. japonica TaxID=39947 RepID=A0A0P0XQJ0_ORYSJ|nr:hypothetical protein EE612_049489 [Oryza sativa]BAT09420.1 Os09g0563225 [Oryza sativa Japonica Group]